MANWIRIAGVSDCPPGQGLECLAEGRIIALFNIDGAYFAIDGVCAHQGGPLAKGRLVGSTVSCPWHGWPFDVCRGQHASNPTIKQASYAVRIEGNSLMVDLESRR